MACEHIKLPDGPKRPTAEAGEWRKNALYGYDTKSWRNSTENRQMKKERAEFTAAWTPGPLIDVALTCVCCQRDYPHELSVHADLRSESFNPRLRQKWPWVLIGAANVGPL